MRIAVIYDCYYPNSTGGGERQYRAFAERFAERGHEVTYLTRLQWDSAPTAAPGVAVRAVAGRAELYDAAGGRRLIPALGFAAAVLWHLLRHRSRYDAVLVSALPTLNVLAVRAALVGRPTAICADFLEVWRLEQWLEYSGPVVGRIAALLQSVAVRLSPTASCHSSMNGRRLTSAGLRSAPVVSPGLIHDQIARRPALRYETPPTVLFVGRMIPDKQVESIPAAVEWARAHVPDLRARLFGDGETRGRVAEEISRRALDDVIDLPGFVEQSVLDEALRTSACLVNPSRREGYGLVVVEACAAGTPVVLVEAPDNASLELVEPGVNGAVAPSTRPEDLGAAIVRVVEAGTELRRTTVEWFDRAATERTMSAAADGILRALQRPAGPDGSQPDGVRSP